MKKVVIGLAVLATAGFFGASNALADMVYDYAEPGSAGTLTLAETPDGLFMTIETTNAKGHTCDLSNYECMPKGSQYDCGPHEGGDPEMVPLVLKIMPDKSLILQPAKGAKSPDGFGAFCGATGSLTGKYVPAK